MFSADPPQTEKGPPRRNAIGAEAGRVTSGHSFTPEALCAAIRDLRAVEVPDRRVQMVVQIVRHHGLDYPEVVAFARAEVERTRCSPYARSEALAQLRHITHPETTKPIGDSLPLPRPVEGDPELTRIATGLGKAAAFRLWLFFRVVDLSGVGQVDKTAAWEQLPTFGIHMTRRYYNALLRRENGRLWAVSKDSKVLHLRSYEKVSKRLTALALKVNPDLVLTNAPGQKFKTISVGGSVADFEAQVLRIWLDSRCDQGMTSIALATLSALFARSANTLRDWLKRAGVEVQPNFTQYAGSNEQLIPAHASLYVTREGSYHVTWRVSNSYTPEPTGERQHQRTPRHVYHVCQHLIEEWLNGHPAGDCGTARSTIAGGGVYRTRRLFFDSSKGAQQARKNAYRHLRWHQDTERPHHVFLGFKRSTRLKKGRGREIGLYECVDPDECSTTSLHERDYLAQHRPRQQQQIKSYRDYLNEG